MIRNIDQRIRAEQVLAATPAALAQRERQFSTLVENSPDIFARFDRSHRHVYVSPVLAAPRRLQNIGGRTVFKRPIALGAELRDEAEVSRQPARAG